MKEIIYLDTELMNSMIAQLGEGLIINYSVEEATQKSETEGQQTAKGKKATIKAQLKISTGVLGGGEALIGADKGNDNTESQNFAQTLLEGQKDILNKSFHDHALNILIDNLEHKKILKSKENSSEDELKEGDIYLEETTFNFYDFSLIDDMVQIDPIKNLFLFDVDTDKIEKAKKLRNKKNLSTREREDLESILPKIQKIQGFEGLEQIFTLISAVSSFFKNSLPSQSIIKAGDKIGVAKNGSLRISSASLSLRPDANRKAKILMRVIGKKEIVYNEGNMPVFTEDSLYKIPNLFFDIFLGSFKMVEVGDYLVTPIAIYYE